MKFKPNHRGYIVMAILIVIAAIASFRNKKKINQFINTIKDTAMSKLYAHLLDNKGKFKLDKSKPRGHRNNNPGNLIKTFINWKGKVESARNSDGHFEQFYEMKFGVRALLKDLLNDINKKGKNTVTQLISEFAPSHENNTTAYMSVVARKMGIGINTPFSPTKENMKNLTKAIIRHENGKNVISDQDFENAWELV